MSTEVQRAMDFISSCNDPKLLDRLARNAAAKGEMAVHRAAKLKMYSVMPAAKPDTLEFDVWQSIHALEDQLTQERNRTTRLSRTRQKIGRQGEQEAVADLIEGRVSNGFSMLAERGMLHLTFEAVALKHPERFSSEVLDAARQRLSSHSRDLSDE